jgi:conjugal transfer pilus assembly protein TraK
MHKAILMGIVALISQCASAATTLTVKDNSDISVTLSTGNYNRLVVKNDKIVEAVFPESNMGIKHDEEDGSVYILPTTATPFTLFLTTQAGHHFSVTLTGEEALGKTIELIPQTSLAKNSKPVKEALEPVDEVPKAVASLISNMEQHKPMTGINIKHLYGRAERLQGGLTLLPKEYWDGGDIQGEIIEVYNGGNKELALSESWFATDDVRAIKFSKGMLAPKERALLYRVRGEVRG